MSLYKTYCWPAYPRKWQSSLLRWGGFPHWLHAVLTHLFPQHKTLVVIEVQQCLTMPGCTVLLPLFSAEQ